MNFSLHIGGGILFASSVPLCKTEIVSKISPNLKQRVLQVNDKKIVSKTKFSLLGRYNLIFRTLMEVIWNFMEHPNNTDI